MIVDCDLQFGDVGIALGLRAGEDDLRPAHQRRRPRCGQDRAVPHAALLGSVGAAGTGPARPGRGDRPRLPAADLPAASLPARLRHRRHPAGVLPRGDRLDRLGHRSLRRRHARRALAQGHEDRSGDARTDGLRPVRPQARPEPCRHERRNQRECCQSDPGPAARCVRALSDRAVPRAVTDGQAIVSASPKSGPAKAFYELANLYLDAAGQAAPDGGTEPSKETSKRRRSLLRKGAVGHGTA